MEDELTNKSRQRSLLSKLRLDVDFARSVAVLSSGGTGAMLVTLALTPIIARLFRPADFGQMAALLALAQPLVTVATLQLGKALTLPKGRDEARALAHSATSWLLVFCVALALVMAVVAGPLDDRVVVDLKRWWWAVPAMVLLLGLTALVNGWNTREKYFATIATGQVSRASATGAARIGAGLTLGSSVGGLITGYLVGALIQLALVGRRLPGDVAAWRPPARLREVIAPIVAYRDFPLFSMPTTFLRAIAQALPQLALAALYSSASVAFYAMAVRLVGAPGNVLATSVRRVFNQRGARIHQAGRSLRGAWLKSTVALVAIGWMPALALVLAAPWLMSTLMGEAWAGTGTYAQLLAALLFTQWASAPSSEVLVILRRQQDPMKLQSAVLAAQLAMVAASVLCDVDALVLVAMLVVVRVLADLALIGAAWRAITAEPSRS
ncbi:MAG: lipopolysaccharide biosynthesis protein [Pseudomonadota bacterium]